MAFTWGQKRQPSFGGFGNAPRRGSAVRDHMNGIAGGVMGQRFQPGFEDYRSAQGAISAYRAPMPTPAPDRAPVATPALGMFDSPDFQPAMRMPEMPDDGGMPGAGMFAGDDTTPRRRRRRGRRDRV